MINIYETLYNSIPSKPASGKSLDQLAELYGLKRKRWWFIFKELDKTLRNRLLDYLKGLRQ